MRPPTATLLPHRALLHPLWLGALAAMAINDHVLKGAGMLPGEVTGKLSDFAGLLVAPLLLAALLCVRGRKGWLAAHVVVGVVFAAIQLSRPFADLWSGAMGLVGFPWAITCDPWDLVALPMLGLSAWYFPRVMAVAPRQNLRQTAEIAAAAGGIAACVATSPADPIDTPWNIEADAYFHNANDFDTVVRLRQLAPEADIDCDAIAEDPGRLLTEAMFGDTESWTVWPRANLPLTQGTTLDRDCQAVRVEADSVQPVIVFWRTSDIAWTFLSGEGLDEAAPGWVSLSYDGDGVGTYETELDILFEAIPPTGRPEGFCAPQPESSRVTYGDAVPEGVWFLGAADVGVDGCVSMDLRTGYEQQEGLEGREWDLCVPRGAFPFKAGQRVEVSGAGDRIWMAELDEFDEQTGLQLIATALAAGDMVYGMQPLFTPEYACDLQVEPACGTVTRPGTVSFAGGGYSTVSAVVGEKVSTTSSTGERLDIHMTRAEERYALNPECAPGPDTLGLDLEVVTVHHADSE